jgi:hypothetical protein
MSIYKFKSTQRYAVYTTHGEKCYLCRRPIDLVSMEVDHVIPESLLGTEKLSDVLQKLGLPKEFNLNSYANWMPACSQCNSMKSNTVFEPTPIFQIILQKAVAKEAKAIAFESETLSNIKITKSLNVLIRAHEAGKLNDKVIDNLKPLIEFHVAHRLPELTGKPIHLTPLYEVISEDSHLQIVRGPYGVGARPAGAHVDSSFNCPNCGTAGAWSGARCVVCGELNED